VHHKVVHIDDEPSFHKVVGKDMVHEHLESWRRIALAKEHHHGFVEPIRSSESGLPLIGLLNPNVVISPSDIEFREILGVFESVNEVGDTRKGVGVLDHMRVNVTIVLAGMERAILLRDKEEGGRLQRLRREDLSFFEILIDERFQRFHFLRVK